jgi:hypothetical protein
MTAVVNPNLAFGWFARGMVKVWLSGLDQAVRHFAHAIRLSPPVAPLLMNVRMLISRAGMMKLSHGQRRHCEGCQISTSHCVSPRQAVRLLGVTKKRRN